MLIVFTNTHYNWLHLSHLPDHEFTLLPPLSAVTLLGSLIITTLAANNVLPNMGLNV